MLKVDPGYSCPGRNRTEGQQERDPFRSQAKYDHCTGLRPFPAKEVKTVPWQVVRKRSVGSVRGRIGGLLWAMFLVIGLEPCKYVSRIGVYGCHILATLNGP